MLYYVIFVKERKELLFSYTYFIVVDFLQSIFL